MKNGLGKNNPTRKLAWCMQKKQQMWFSFLLMHAAVFVAHAA